MENESQKNLTVFDDLIQDRQLLMLKAAIPYINGSSQKTMAMMVKFMELQRTVTLFDSPQTTLQMCSAPEDEEPAPLRMLTTIREYCTKGEQETIDMLINYVQMFTTYETLFT